MTLEQEIITLTFDVSDIDRKCEKCGKHHSQIPHQFEVQYFHGEADSILWNCECRSTLAMPITNLNLK